MDKKVNHPFVYRIIFELISKVKILFLQAFFNLLKRN
jgi:hypothetical protein